ncbi:pyrroline-5-carboxylate reductase [Candidatus Vesicomyidisocius calyptogenae]|uniref:Pyrroline-5-carboxylate reductase n=1 Tax=Vesicomyosocius okutanii subsp. Calyptogena okutanii (strain HA) TaxID=412965 RepID=A5CXR7_VESOH|nr:pyrroline-5-carboxylate reductase [Candidatus Vesicomyosocius okutanii]BAF61255.1 pyrroline-5-carboxylate reductase [Candidatus Vesicomyosocius okutanii]
MQNSLIGFIGAGNMTHAIISGLINNNTNHNQIKISDTNEALLLLRKTEFNIEIFTDNTKLATQCSTIIFAVKPQVLSSVCKNLKNKLTTNTLIISIAAGVRSHDIERWLGGNQAIIRTMPNTPALLNQGITGLFANKQVSNKQKFLAENILNSVGECLWVNDEYLLNAITAVSGSGPAYFFLMLESMTKAGVTLGLDEVVAQKLSIQTALGASMMASRSKDSPQQLRNKVTSKNGTTQAAIESLQNQDFEIIIAHAIRAASDKSNKIGIELSNDE